MPADILNVSDLPDLKLFKRGKVRDVYDVQDNLLVISTDRISCFDFVLPTCIPDKGEVLTRLSMFWFDFTRDIIPNHFITASVKEYPAYLHKYQKILQGRSMLARKAKPIPVECVVRGYLSGSGWKEYKISQSICGIKLDPGMVESDKLKEPIFTPSTKEDAGHDMNVTMDFVEKTIGKDTASELKEISTAIYGKASHYAESKGIIIADTKFEFGIYEGRIILIDEALTPDSSRFWPKNGYAPGRPQPSFDKQFVRDYLESICWPKTPPAPELPKKVILKTREKYIQAFEVLTGKTW
ncbi:MAG: phosphoribosylaminoimidazolesuccinocarboxamide synthase [Candidatus Omnitrophica bacterium]|jgi:phosphoribosylaminoimidazole-succinocarboxamide synthase|nr:phosphoribosylaminoimidazolesuccinocarboxamide synthase [Candidatus Omnitrophota bacterium]